MPAIVYDFPEIKRAMRGDDWLKIEPSQYLLDRIFRMTDPPTLESSGGDGPDDGGPSLES